MHYSDLQTVRAWKVSCRVNDGDIFYTELLSDFYSHAQLWCFYHCSKRIINSMITSKDKYSLIYVLVSCF